MAISARMIRARADEAQVLTARIPSDALLTVRANAAHDRHAFTILALESRGPLPLYAGRFDVVAAWINGYLYRCTRP